MNRIAKRTAECFAFLGALPALLLFWMQSLVLGRAGACASISQRAARWPGNGGVYLRRMLLRRVVSLVGKDVVISFGTVLTKPSAELGDRVYIGSYCLLGDVRIGDNTLIADHVCIPSGPGQHGLRSLDVPIREQQGEFRTIRIGRDCWIGSGAVILADVGDHCVVAAGGVVTKPVADYQIVGGSPARPIGDRRKLAAETGRGRRLQAG